MRPQSKESGPEPCFEHLTAVKSRRYLGWKDPILECWEPPSRVAWASRFVPASLSLPQLQPQPRLSPGIADSCSSLSAASAFVPAVHERATDERSDSLLALTGRRRLPWLPGLHMPSDGNCPVIRTAVTVQPSTHTDSCHYQQNRTTPPGGGSGTCQIPPSQPASLALL